LGGPRDEEQSVQAASPVPTVEAAIPLPRARPVLANLLPGKSDPATVSSDNRTMFEKLADLVPMRFSLASLTPGDGLLGERKDLTALGYDGQTAVYDISAQPFTCRTVPSSRHTPGSRPDGQSGVCR